MFAGAAFTDASDFAVDSDVVDTLVALGVIDGYDDGSFRPEATVTRAEMAKMIYTIRTGRSDASAYNNDATSFTDISDHWARGYIKYCQSLGIIAGKSTTKFDPDATVTTQEAAKMLLVTLGYNAEKAGLEGTGWGAKTTALADENGLLKDVNCGTTQGMPRQYAAQLIYNAIFANTVVLRDGEYTNMNLLGTAKNPTIGEKYMSLISYNTTLLGYKDKVVQLASNNGQRFNDYTVDHSDLVGKQVQVLYKEAATSTGKSTIYGIFLDDDYSYADTIVGNVKDPNAAKDEIKIDGTKTDVASDATATVKGWTNTKSAQPVTVVYNDKNEVYDLDLDTNFKVSKISYVGSTKVTIDASYEIEDIELYDGYAKDDWVVKSYNDYTEKFAFAKADVVTGKVEVINGADITIDGTVYTKADDAVSITGVDLGNTVEAVIVNGYIYNAEKVSGIASLDEIVYVNGAKVDKDYSKETAKVQAVRVDGTTVELTVEAVEKANNVGSALANEAAVKSAINSNGSAYLDGLWAIENNDDKYTLKKITTGDGKDFEDGDTTVITAGDDRIGSYRVNDEAVVFVIDGDGDVYVKTGKDVKAWSKGTSATGVAYGDKVSGFVYVDVAALKVAGDVPGASYDAIYGYVVKELGETKEDNKKYTSYSVWTGAENETIKVESGKVHGAVVKGSFVKVENDDIYNLNVVAGAAIGKVAAFDSDTVTFRGVAGEYKITDDTKILYVDTDADVVEGIGGGEIKEATDHNTSGVYEDNAYYVVDTADLNGADGWDLVAIIVDINNELVAK